MTREYISLLLFLLLPVDLFYLVVRGFLLLRFFLLEQCDRGFFRDRQRDSLAEFFPVFHELITRRISAGEKAETGRQRQGSQEFK